jgi:hypothetical protein
MRKNGVINGFSIELKSKNYMKNLTIMNSSVEKVLFEGDLGDFEDVHLIEGVVLVVEGTHGTLRVELPEDKIKNMISVGRKDEQNNCVQAST